jgi:hypothetical protein
LFDVELHPVERPTTNARSSGVTVGFNAVISASVCIAWAISSYSLRPSAAISR